MKGSIEYAAVFLGIFVMIGLFAVDLKININVPGGVCVEETAPIISQPRHVF